MPGQGNYTFLGLMCDREVDELCVLHFFTPYVWRPFISIYGTWIVSDPFPRDQLSGIFTAFPAAFRRWVANSYFVFRLYFQKDFHTDHDALTNS